MEAVDDACGQVVVEKIAQKSTKSPSKVGRQARMEMCLE
jgi:hypothetical protein